MSTILPNSMKRNNKRMATYDEPQEKQLMPNSSRAPIAQPAKVAKLCILKTQYSQNEKEWKSGKTKSENNDVEVGVKSQMNVFHLNCDVWRMIFQFLPASDVVFMSTVCKQFQQIVQNTNNSYNLRKNYRLDVECFLNHALSKSCTSIDINNCSWLTPNTIIEMILKTNLRHIHVIECQVNEDCVRSICNLSLQSLSYTYAGEWRSYFIGNTPKCLPFSQTLNILTIQFEKSICSSHAIKSKPLIFDIFVNFLQYCKELQHLRLFDDFMKWNVPGKKEVSEFPSQTTPLLKLTSLEIALHPFIYKKDVLNFVKALLQDKVIPLKNVDFGDLTCYLLNNGIVRHPLILPNSDRFILSRFRWELGGDCYEDYEDKISNWMSQKEYKSVFFHNLKFNNFAAFAEKMVSSSGKSLKKLFIRDCTFFENVVKGLQLFANHCSQMTTLHLTIVKRRAEASVGFYNHDQMTKNEAIIETISHLKNLKELVISALIVQCSYYNPAGAQWIKVMPFWKVTKSCEKLIEIRLLNGDTLYNPPTIHMASINDIANHCKNLRVLQLKNFSIYGDKNFRLSGITKNCTKLEHLDISNIFNDNIYVGNYMLKFEDSLCSAKELRILRIDYARRYVTKAFLNSLRFCEKLENIWFCLRGGVYEHRIDVTNLIEDLSKLKNLYVFQIQLVDGDGSFNEQLIPLFEKIKSERPAFSYQYLYI